MSFTEFENHRHTGTDGQPVSAEDLILADSTKNNASTAKHGFLPKLSGSASDVLLGDGSFGALSTSDPYSMNSKLATYNTFTIPLLANIAAATGAGIAGAEQSGVDTASEFWGSYAEFKSNSSSAYYRFKLPGATGNSVPNYQWGENQKIFASFRGMYFGSGGAIWGFATTAISLYTLNHATAHSAVFESDAANTKLYARTSNGTTATRTDITSGLTISNWNLYRIEVDLTNTNVKFYVNNVLKATHTTNLPSTSNVYFGAGLDTSGIYNYMTAPIISIQE